jgi:hypothetical protein
LGVAHRNGIVILHFFAKERCPMSATATKPDKSIGSATNKDAQTDAPSQAERGQTNGQPKRRPERVFRVGNCWATVWCNEHQQKSGPSQFTTRIIRSVNLERRFWNEKLKDGKGDWDSSYGYGLADVHNALAALQLAADYLKQAEADVTRDA